MCEARTTACVVVAMFLLAGCGNDIAPSTGAQGHGRGLTVELPPGWQAASTNLTPNLGDPRQVFAAATYPLRYRPHQCAQVPVSALKDLGPDDAFVELEERGLDPSSTWDDFSPRPAHFDRARGDPSEAADCVPGKRISDHWFSFTDGGRHFYALVVFGPAASEATKNEAWEMLDSLEVDPGRRPDWKAAP